MKYLFLGNHQQHVNGMNSDSSEIARQKEVLTYPRPFKSCAKTGSFGSPERSLRNMVMFVKLKILVKGYRPREELGVPRNL